MERVGNTIAHTTARDGKLLVLSLLRPLTTPVIHGRFLFINFFGICVKMVSISRETRIVSAASGRFRM